MITLDSIRNPVTAELAAFDEFVERQFTAEGELLSDMLRYALSSRGKGIRPLLVMLSAAMNASVPGAATGRRACLAAMLVEMIHVASLIHDDVIDEADTRRGKPSVNARWQSHKAVILGDYILARNMAIGLTSGQFDLVTHVCGSMAALCEGEVLQDECAETHDMTRRTYLDIIHKKTASLLGVSASAGALAVGATRDRVALMRRFGEALGMAFQMQDDILDYTLSAHTGKPANNDLREGKITLPLLAVLEKVSDERRAELIERLGRCRQDEASVEYLQCTVVNEGGSLVGHTTDGEGYMRSAREAGFQPEGKRMVQLGAGGAGTAVLVQAALDGMAAIDVFNPRDAFWPRAERVAAELERASQCRVVLHDLDDREALRTCLGQADLLVNTTPVGMERIPGCLIPDASWLHAGLTVSDVIYQPRETQLLRMAREAGLKTFNGMYMLLHQGAASFRLWTGREMPIQQIREKYFQ